MPRLRRASVIPTRRAHSVMPSSSAGDDLVEPPLGEDRRDPDARARRRVRQARAARKRPPARFPASEQPSASAARPGSPDALRPRESRAATARGLLRQQAPQRVERLEYGRAGRGRRHGRTCAARSPVRSRSRRAPPTGAGCARRLCNGSSRLPRGACSTKRLVDRPDPLRKSQPLCAEPSSRTSAAFRDSARTFFEREAVPHTEGWETAGLVDRLLDQGGREWLRGFRGAGGVRRPRPGGLPIQRDPHRGGRVRRRGGDNFSLENDIIAPYLVNLTNPTRRSAGFRPSPAARRSWRSR